jgi:hypothetical protein
MIYCSQRSGSASLLHPELSRQARYHLTVIVGNVGGLAGAQCILAIDWRLIGSHWWCCPTI